MKVANALCAGSGKVTRDEAADPDVLRGIDQVLLCWDQDRVDGADDDVGTIEGFCELLDAVVNVPDANINPGCTELINVRLLGGGWTNKCSETLLG